MPKWHRPFRSRGRSREFTLNFLWEDGPLFVMDNHLAALWCWWQRLDDATQFRLLHIDRHYDLLRSRLPEWMQNLPSANEGIDAFVNKRVNGDRYHQTVRWDNYLAIFLERHYHQLVEPPVFAVNGIGRNAGADECDRTELLVPKFETDSWGVPILRDSVKTARWNIRRLNCFAMRAFVRGLTDGPGNWIVNVDLDYFTGLTIDDRIQWRMPDAVVAEIGRDLKLAVDSGRVRVLTVALSPETTGSWDEAERLLKVMLGDFPNIPDFTVGQ
ncbi:MAG: hypothetical protein AMXMBFR57_01500 [Acidimicrobiia bacterium]